jgi:SAM-dependent methyltransferase
LLQLFQVVSTSLPSELICRYLLSLGKIFDAIQMMERAVQLDCDFLLAREGVENMKGLVVDQWHFRMINDQPRNEAYNVAIQRALERKPQAIVLDIGGGTGLLSMYAARAGASHVYCCEVSPHMARLARRCIESNGFSDRITVIEAHSTDLFIVSEQNDSQCLSSPDSCFGLPHRVSVIVTELVDSGLLGEHIITVLQDARKRLLVAEGGIVIPHGAEVFGVPIMSLEIADRQSPQPPPPSCHWSTASYRQLIQPQSTLESRIPFPLVSVDEDYTCESFKSLTDSGRLVSLSRPQCLGYVTFFPASVSTTSASFTVPGQTSFQLTPTASGLLHAMATWFTLHLEDPSISGTGPEVPKVDTSPGQETCGWDQAILFLNHRPSLSLQAQPHRLIAGQPLTLVTEFREDKIAVRVPEPLLSSPSSAMATTLYPIGEMDMAALNRHLAFDSSLAQLQEALETLSRTLPLQPIRFIELCHGWRSSLVTLWLHSLTRPCHSDSPSFCGPEAPELIVHATSGPQCQYLTHLLAFHTPSTSAPTPLLPLPELVSGPLLELASSLSQRGGGGKSVVVCDLVEGCGLLRQSVFADLSLLVHALGPSAEVQLVPHSLTVRVALLEHGALWRQSRIQSSNTAGVGSTLLSPSYSFSLHLCLPPPSADRGLVAHESLRRIADPRGGSARDALPPSPLLILSIFALSLLLQRDHCPSQEVPLISPLRHNPPPVGFAE